MVNQGIDDQYGLNTLRKSGLPSFSSLTPPAGETTQGEAGCEDFFNSLLGVS